MAFHMNIIGDNTLEIIYTGKVRIEDSKAVRENAIAMINSNELNQIFVDVRQAELDIGFVDLFNFAASNKKVYPTIRRAAILYSDNDKIRPELEMYVRAAGKRRFKIRMFSDLNKIKKWLHIVSDIRMNFL